MTTGTARRFNNELKKLFDARTYQLKTNIWPGRGPVLKITKKKIRRSIAKLEDLAEIGLLRSKNCKHLLRDFDYKKQWHPKLGKGYGRFERKRRFKEWYERHIATQNCVYAFWSPHGCLYVGRTLNGKGRPSSHFEKYWFGKATRLDIYAFERKRDVPRFECMFTHRHGPSYSKIRPASKKFYSRCPICDVREQIRTDVKSLFRLR